MKVNNLRIVFITLLLAACFAITACSKSETPADISNQFWGAVQERDMEAAKLVSTWDTVDYLKYLNTDKLHPERYELGEQMVGETRAEVATVLYTSKPGNSGIKLPGVTVLVKTKQGWRVNVKKSMTSVVKYSANNVFDQLNGLMQEGIKGLDQSLSEAMNELGNTLEDSAEEFKRELARPLFSPDLSPNNQLDIVPGNKPIEDPRGKRI